MFATKVEVWKNLRDDGLDQGCPNLFCTDLYGGVVRAAVALPGGRGGGPAEDGASRPLDREPGSRAWGLQLERRVLEGRGETLSPAVQGRVAAGCGLGGSGRGQMPEEKVA